MTASFLAPPALRPGDRIAVIAPSSPFDRTLLLRGLAFLGERYRVDFDWRLFERDGFLAGSDDRRSSELQRAVADPSVAALVAARGGYGSTRIMHRIDWRGLREAPKWLVGYSDITALHVEAQRVGVCSLHADNAAGLGRADAAARTRWLEALEAPERAAVWPATHGFGGSVTGPVVGGNLTVLFTAAVTGRLALPDGALLALEDVTESSYRIDRMLSALRVGGHLRGVAGLLFGSFSECGPGQHRVPVPAVIEAEARLLGVPALFGLPFGHEPPNLPLPLGRTATLDGAAATLSFA